MAIARAPSRTMVTNAACRDSDLDFYAQERRDWQELRLVCMQCPVRMECLGYALDTRQSWGVWGGASQRDLREAGGYDVHGDAFPYAQPPHCPACRHAKVEIKRKNARCLKCGFTWIRLRARAPSSAL